MQKLKTIMPLLLAFLSLVGMIAVAYIQSKSASKDDINVLVAQLNDKTIPYLQGRLDDIADRLGRIEGKMESRAAILAPMAMKSAPSLEFMSKKSIPKLKSAE